PEILSGRRGALFGTDAPCLLHNNFEILNSRHGAEIERIERNHVEVRAVFLKRSESQGPADVGIPEVGVASVQGDSTLGAVFTLRVAACHLDVDSVISATEEITRDLEVRVATLGPAPTLYALRGGHPLKQVGGERNFDCVR